MTEVMPFVCLLHANAVLGTGGHLDSSSLRSRNDKAYSSLRFSVWQKSLLEKITSRVFPTRRPCGFDSRDRRPCRPPPCCSRCAERSELCAASSARHAGRVCASANVRRDRERVRTTAWP